MKHSHCRFPSSRTPMRPSPWLIPFCAALCLLGALISPPASAAAPAGALVLPMDHLTRLLADAKPLGRMDAAKTLSPEIVLPLRNKAELEDLIHRLYDKSDPLYGHYLKPDQFTARFGPTLTDVKTVADWATSKGLKVSNISSNHTLIKVTGPVRTVEAAFGVQINEFTASDGRRVFAPDRAVTIPAMGASVLDVVGLNNVAKGHSFLHPAPMHSTVVTNASPGQVNGSGVGGALSPYDVHTIYNVPTGSGYNGTGQTLGLFELDGFTASDITTFEDQYTGVHVPITPVSVDGFSTNPTDNGIIPEVTLDIDLELAMAQNASQIKVYEGPGDSEGFQTLILNIFNAMAADDACSVISVSYGLSEDSFSDSDKSADNSVAFQLASQGEDVCVSSGDAGAYTDEYASSPNTSHPGSMYYITSVGGTDLQDSSSYPYTYVSESSWSDTGDTGRGPRGTGGGGGVSSYWAFPYYQNEIVTNYGNSEVSTSNRNVPDVSLYGDYDTGGYSIYLTTIGGGSGWASYNGTSASSPLWAGFLGVVNQVRNYNGFANLGFANPALYDVYAHSYYRDFHDINDNSNNLYYHAVSGYDLSTGIGSFNGANLIEDLTQFTYGPSNDNFASAISVFANPAYTASVSGNNLNATQESGEPLNTSGSGGHSVWWSWTAPTSGTATIDTYGSDYDTTLGVYTGSAVNSLTQIAANDDNGGTLQSAVSFSCVGGTTYYISVNGYTINEGAITLHVAMTTPPPYNDNFANAIPVYSTAAATETYTGTNFGATQESGEPLNTTTGFGSGGHSVWWSWTAPGTGTATIDTYGSNFDTTLGVYTGSAVNALTQVAADDDAGGTLQSAVSFSAVAGTTYYISVNGYYYNEGSINLDVAEAVAPPGNDAFVNRYTISASPGAPGTATGNNAAATQESGEPLNTGGSGGHSIWWTWTASVSTSVTIDTYGSNFDTTLGVYTGSAANALTLVAADDDSNGTLQSSVTFTAVAGTAYQILVDGYSLHEGNVTLHVTQSYVAPTITSFSPTSGPIGRSVTITGSGFTGTTAVAFNGTAASYAVNSDTQITATVPSGATSGYITVSNSSGTATSSSSFTVIQPPTITSFSPTVGHAGTVVTINGTNFTGATSIRFYGASATSFTVVSATQITVTAPSGASTGYIKVTTPGGTAQSSGNFTYAAAPTISSFTPTSGPIGTIVTINGTNFAYVSSVRFIGANATTFSANGAGTQITVTVPTGASSGYIKVTAPGGTVQSSGSFTVTAAPIITSFSPTKGTAGQTVVLMGHNFTGATSVKFHGTNAAAFTIVSDTQINASAPLGGTNGTISVTNSHGTGTSAASFTYLPPPTLSGFTPIAGPVGTVVTFTGTGFSVKPEIKFNGTHAVATYINDTTMTAPVPSGATTGKITLLRGPVVLVTSPNNFTVTSAPVISSFTPASGFVGSVVTINGANFSGVTSIRFIGANATTFSSNGAGHGHHRYRAGGRVVRLHQSDHAAGNGADGEQLHGDRPADDHLVLADLRAGRDDRDTPRDEPARGHIGALHQRERDDLLLERSGDADDRDRACGRAHRLHQGHLSGGNCPDIGQLHRPLRTGQTRTEQKKSRGVRPGFFAHPTLPPRSFLASGGRRQ